MAEESAGIAPDSALHGLDRAMESISLALTFGKAAKAEKRLVHAEERLAEVQAMMEKDKLEHAEKAEKMHQDKISQAEKDLEALEESKGEKELEKVAKIQDKVESHYQKVTEVKDGILERMREQKTPEQFQHMEQVFNRIKEKAMEMEEKTVAKKEEAKLKVQSGGKDPEAAEDEADRKAGLDEGRKERSEKELKHATEALNKAKQKLAELGESEDSLADAEQVLEDVKTSGDHKRIRDVAEEAKDFGNEVSVIAKELGDAKQAGTFEQVKERLQEQIAERHRYHLEEMLTDAPADAQQRIQERIVAFEARQERLMINSFEECMAAGNVATETDPRVCEADGKTWTERVKGSDVTGKPDNSTGKAPEETGKPADGKPDNSTAKPEDAGKTSEETDTTGGKKTP